MGTKDLLSLVIASLAFLSSVVFFILNRRFSRRLFEVGQYPEVEFSFEVCTRRQAEGWIPGFPDKYLTIADVHWRNETKVDAVDLKFILTLTRGLRRVTWEVYDDQKPRASALERGNSLIKLHAGVANLCKGDVKAFSRRSEGRVIGVTEEWLEKEDPKRALRLGLFVDVRWRAPIYKSKSFMRSHAAVIWPETGDWLRQTGQGNVIISWTGKPRSRLLPRFLAWRPRTVKLETDVTTA